MTNQTKAIPLHVTIYQKQKAIVEQILKDNPAFNNNFSLALRFVIDHYAALRQGDGKGKNDHHRSP